jgi:hypothetical protein
MLRVVLLVIAIALSNQSLSAGPKKGSQKITASGASGTPRPATAEIGGPASIECLNASSSGYAMKTSCIISAPGYSGTVEIGHTVDADGPGTVVLTCTGQGFVRCSALITPRT